MEARELSQACSRRRWRVSDGSMKMAMSVDPLTLAELGEDFKILYFFQDWCLSAVTVTAFPTFAALAKELRGKGIGLGAQSNRV